LNRAVAEFVCGELRQSLHEGEEALDFFRLEHVLGERAELGHVLFARERPGAERMGDGDFFDDCGAILHRDLHAAPEGFLCRVDRVVATSPLRVFLRGDIIPQGDGVRAVGALRCVAALMVPFAVLQRDSEDVRDRVVERFAGRLRRSRSRCACGGWCG